MTDKIRDAARKSLIKSAAWQMLCEEYMIEPAWQAILAEGLVNAVLRAVADEELSFDCAND